MVELNMVGVPVGCMVMAHGSGLDRAALETDGRRAWRGKVPLLVDNYAVLPEYQNSEQNRFFLTANPYAPF